MLSIRVNRIIESLKLTKTDRDELNRLVSRPEVRAILNADETDQIKHRRALIKELEAIPAQIKKAHAAAEKEAKLVTEQFEAAEAAYKTAQAALIAVRATGSYIGYQETLRDKAIKNELIAGADPRVNEYRYEVGQIIGRVRSKMEYWIGRTPKNWVGNGGDEVLFSNVDDVAAAREELDKGLAVLHELELSAITTAETTQALNDLTHTLAAPLAKLDMFPPTLDEHGKVTPPHRDGSKVVEAEAA